jgi:cytoskeletal protein CcmA (bactofilin family)
MSNFTGSNDSTALLDEPQLEIASDGFSPDEAQAQPSADAFDPREYFDRWLEDVHAGPPKLTPETQENPDDSESPGIFIESLPGSNCEVTFEGVLHFNGLSIGNIRSPEGTLVLTKRGRVEADINVGTALINGTVTGNIIAAERVLLDSNARVVGQIITPRLSVRLGAVFDGDCVFASSSEPVVEVKPVEEPPEKLQRVAAGA